jgi:RNase P subunit RPR2
MNYTLLALTVAKKAKAKAMPIIKGMACKRCGSLATLALVNNEIKVSRCACHKKGN